MSEDKDELKNLNRLEFEFAHMGINPDGEMSAVNNAEMFGALFGFKIKNGNSSIFASSEIELLKNDSYGENGHIAIYTANIRDAMAYFKEKNVRSLPGSYKYRDEKLVAAYLDLNIGGFILHLLQK